MNSFNGIPPPPPRKINRNISIRVKLLAVFGSLIICSILVLAFMALNIAKVAVQEKIEIHLKDKATDTANIIDARIGAFFQFIEGIARAPVLQSAESSWIEKSQYLAREVGFNKDVRELSISDLDGNLYFPDGKIISVLDREYFNVAKLGKNFLTEPYQARTDKNLIITLSVPVRGYNNQIVAVLSADLVGEWLSNNIKDIVVGKTGSCSIEGVSGNTIAYKDMSLVYKQFNGIKEAEKNAEYASYAGLLKNAIASQTPSVEYYTYEGSENISSYSKMKNVDWVVILTAPINEFMGTVYTLQYSMLIIGGVILMVALCIVYFVAYRMVKPIQNTVLALQGIAQGDGDLTVRLPITGNDEITNLSIYFNQTIEKIGASIKAVGNDAERMEEIGTELSSNMTETASSVHEISSNIESVKNQALTQAKSVTETATTIEEITRTIKQLNASIENQTASVAQSSSSIEEMVANIKSITGTLEKSDVLINELGTATADGKETLTKSNTVTNKIAEESGSLMEASSVIQHIASQTNLLAMNAAIEAAHAGEAGKGFAVVADEIRKLAEDSATQGKTITSTLKLLSGEIDGLSSSSKIVETKFNAIFNLAEEVKEMSHRLTEAMKEQENGSREVLTAIKEINMVTSEVQQGSAEMLKGSEGVAKEMEKLDGLTRVITDSMNEMAAGATQISNAMQEVAGITQKNKMSISSLVNEVGKFKV